MPNLKVLNLSNNSINNISFLTKSKMNNLKALFLNGNFITDIDVFQKIFPLLEILNLENNFIHDINIFNKVIFKENIKELYLDNNEIEKFKELNLCYCPSQKKLAYLIIIKNYN